MGSKDSGGNVNNVQALDIIRDLKVIRGSLEKWPYFTPFRTMTKFCTDNIVKSSEDKRQYRALILNNDLNVVLVSDPYTDKAAAALSVSVGFMSDPEELPGLAHFCEHMLFLGTEKYPSENEYNKFLSEHGGSSNACTGADHTDYYFDVVPEQLEGALDRFSQFFLSPMFTESATSREVNTVDSEHSKNIPNDLWRAHQLEQSTAKPDHPYNRFGTGNKVTLDINPKSKGVNVRDELLKFHDKWYSSNIMSLAVLGKQDLDALQMMVETMFINVKNKEIVSPEWLEHPLGPEQLCKWGLVVPVKDLRSLNITFPVPDLRKQYKACPERYLTHLLGHESPGSLLSALKVRGWANHLEAGSRSGARGFSFFVVNLDLTEDGLCHTEDIVDLVFQYINMLKKEKPKQWIFNEYCKIMSTNFRFKDKELPRNYVVMISCNMKDFALEDVLCGPFLSSQWEPELITNVLNLLTPENCRIGILSKTFEVEADMEEPWYGVKYTIKPFSSEVIKRWSMAEPSDELKLPSRNEFLPSDFDLVPREVNTSQYPTVILDSNVTRVWFKQDDEFLLPKANLTFEFVSPLAYCDPLHSTLTDLYVMLARDALTEYVYDAELAGMKWDLCATKYGLILTVGGYTSKQHVFLERIIDKITNLNVDPQRFAILKENYVRGLKNFKAEQPYQHAVYHTSVLLIEQAWTKEELLEGSEFLTIEKLKLFIPDLLSMVHVECLLHGNLDKQRALYLASIIESKISKDVVPLLPPHLIRCREIELKNCGDYVFKATNETHTSSCAEIYLQCPIQSTHCNILIELFVHIAHEPCFNILRTKEQLGYIVMLGLRRGHSTQGVRIIVQSHLHPVIVDQRIEAFLASMEDYLVNMTTEEFMRHKTALAAQRLEKPKKLSVKTARYWNEIYSQQYNFERDAMEVAYLRNVSQADVLQFYWDYISLNSSKRHKLAVHVVSMASKGAGETTDDSIVMLSPPHVSVIEDITLFKNNQAHSPLVEPYMNIKPKGARAKL